MKIFYSAICFALLSAFLLAINAEASSLADRCQSKWQFSNTFGWSTSAENFFRIQGCSRYVNPRTGRKTLKGLFSRDRANPYDKQAQWCATWWIKGYRDGYTSSRNTFNAEGCSRYINPRTGRSR